MLTQDDIQQIGRFVREFVTMSLVPWMEKCVVEWNENVCLASSCRVMLAHLRRSTRRPDVSHPACSRRRVGFSGLRRLRLRQLPQRMDPAALSRLQTRASLMGRIIRSAPSRR